MEIYSPAVFRPGIAITALAAAAGLILTGCGSSSGSSATATQLSAAAKSPGGGTSPGGATPPGASSAPSSSGSATAVVSPGSLPFPTTPGDTWIYRTAPGSTSEIKITSVTQVASGQEVRMDSIFKDHGATTTSHYSYIFQPNGEISLPFSQFGSSHSAGSSFSEKLISGGMYWPSAAQLATGQPYHSTMTLAYTIEGKTQKATTHVTATGEGTQSVTVPAGTYHATVVSMLETLKLDGVTVSTDVRTWLAPGVGPVQSEIVNLDGATNALASKEELTSFVRG